MLIGDVPYATKNPLASLGQTVGITFCCSYKEHKRQLEYAYMVRTQAACGCVKK